MHPKYGPDTYGGQFSRPTGAAADAATYNLADFLVGARSTYELVNPFVFHLRQRMHFGYVQDDWRASPKLTVNLGAALRVRHAAVGRGQLPDQLRSGDATRCIAGEGRIDLRPRARQPGQEQLRAARRRRLQPDAARPSSARPTASSYIHFNRLGGENLLSFNGPHVVPIAITQQPSQGPCAGNQAPTTCFRPTQQGYPEGLNVPANFNPLNGRVNYIPPDTNTGNVQNWHVTVQRELLRTCSSTSPTSATAAAIS